MVSNVSSSSSGIFYPNMKVNNTLSDDQKTSLKEIISNYDPKNMSEDDWKIMMDEIKSSGIGPGEDMKQIMEDAGFDKPMGMKPPEMPPQKPNVDNKETLDLIKDYLSKKDNNEITDEEFDNFLQSLIKSQETTNGIFLDKSV